MSRIYISESAEPEVLAYLSAAADGAEPEAVFEDNAAPETRADETAYAESAAPEAHADETYADNAESEESEVPAQRRYPSVFPVGTELVPVAATKFVSPKIASHPDLYYCKLGAADDAPVFCGVPEKLGARYPKDVRYNAVVCGKYLIHNLRCTDPELRRAASAYVAARYGCELREIHTAQGYTKCNAVVVDDGHIITEDAGIARAVRQGSGGWIDVLQVTPKQVRLPGFPNGFLGGATGRIADTVFFHGDLSAHPDFEKIREYIEACGLSVKFFEGFPLTDIGSIIYEETRYYSGLYSASRLSE